MFHSLFHAADLNVPLPFASNIRLKSFSSATLQVFRDFGHCCDIFILYGGY